MVNLEQKLMTCTKKRKYREGSIMKDFRGHKSVFERPSEKKRRKKKEVSPTIRKTQKKLNPKDNY